MSPNNVESKKCQYLALLCTGLTNFGDAVELFLPSVITQPVSCELGITKEQEHILALALYFTLTLTSVLIVPFSNKFGRKPSLLVGLYLAIIVTVLCSIVSNFTFLLVSRILLGIALAINVSTVGVYMSEIAVDKDFYRFSMTVLATVYSLGGGWCGILGYFFLDLLGWRYFILITSFPIFLPPVVMLHFYLPESRTACKTGEKELLDNDAKNTVTVTAVTTRLCKICSYMSTRGIVYQGAILLVPVLMRDINAKTQADTPCGAIHGFQFLIVTALFGVCHLFGRSLNYLTNGRLSSTAVLISASLVVLPWSIIIDLFSHQHILLFIGLGVIQIVGSFTGNELFIMGHEKKFFAEKYLAMSGSLQACIAYLVLAVGNTISEILAYQTTLHIHLAFSVINLIISLSFIHKD